MEISSFSAAQTTRSSCAGTASNPARSKTLLEHCAGVRQAVVIAREDREGDKRLVAYLVAESSGAETAGALRSALGSKLPDYMVPRLLISSRIATH